jgi:hypothetical protein
MTITYTWKDITIYADRDKFSDDDTVSKVEATLVGTSVDGSVSENKLAVGIGNTTPGYQDGNNPNFIPFSNLTSEDIVAFVESALAEGDALDGYKQPIVDELTRFRIKSF